jgi:hypothetical protein
LSWVRLGIVLRALSIVPLDSILLDAAEGIAASTSLAGVALDNNDLREEGGKASGGGE